MKTQVVYIHGGDLFETQEEYLAYLRDYKIESLDNLNKKRWRDSLQERLGDDYEVILPEMPNKRNARYLEWKIWFEKIIPFLGDGVILIGGSLGGIFLTKYLSENIFPKKIAGLFIAAAPFGNLKPKYSLADFNLPASLEKIPAQVSEIYFYHSKDDDVVPFTEMEKYKKLLPNAHYAAFEDRGHFSQKEFPEAIRDIQNLRK